MWQLSFVNGLTYHRTGFNCENSIIVNFESSQLFEMLT